MPAPPLDLRLDHLLRHRNEDRCWGYYPGKESWTEPTVYTALALARRRPEEARAALEALRRRQRSDGAWAASARLGDPHWSTALVLLLHQALEVRDARYQSGLDWLLRVEGEDGSWMTRVRARLGQTSLVEQDTTLHGWPWRPGSASWVEPTALTLACLKRTSRATDEARQRVVTGERLLLDRRCEDRGWNYGNRRVYGVALDSYPETTGIALVGLQGRPGLEDSLTKAAQQFARAPQGMGRAWLRLALQCHGTACPDGHPADRLAPGGDISVTALEALGGESEGWRIFAPEAAWARH